MLKLVFLKFMVPCILLAVITLSSFKSSETFKAPHMNLQIIKFSELNKPFYGSRFNSVNILLTNETRGALKDSPAIKVDNLFKFNSKVDSVLAKY